MGFSLRPIFLGLLVLFVSLLSCTHIYASGGVSSNFGSFSTEIPIAVPSYYGIEPQIKLSYSSGGGNSIVGVGWLLGGRSSIVRASKGGGVPKYTDEDIYYYDGAELIPNTSLGGTHCTKIQNYSQITYDNVSNSWVVIGTSGNKVIYEPVFETSKGTYKWLLTKIKDTHGNTVNYNYWCDGDPIKSCYLKSITYNENKIAVKFNYEERPDSILFSNGVGFEKIERRLKSIDVRVSGNRVRAYAINYKISPETNRSLITQVQQFGNDALIDNQGSILSGTSLPPMKFEYQKGNDSLFPSYIEFISPGGNGAGYVKSADLNVDGIADLIKIAHDNQVYSFLSHGDGTFGPPSVVSCPGESESGYYNLADLDGNGLIDLVKHDSTGKVYVFFSNGNGSFADYKSFEGPGGEGEKFVSFADVNGDGRTDLIKHNEDGILYAYLSDLIITELPDGSESKEFVFTAPKTTGGAGGNGEGLIRLADLNGDKKVDLIKLDKYGKAYIYFSNGDGSFEYKREIEVIGSLNFVDVNADGCSDMIVSRDGTVTTYLSKADGTFEAVVNTNLTDGSGADIFIDINSDRLADLLQVHENTSGDVSIYFSNGNGTFSKSKTIQIFSLNDVEFINFADLDGDGLVDLLKYNEIGILDNYLSSLASSEENHGVPDLIDQVFNGIGGSSTIAYTPSSVWENTFMPFVSQTVSKITASDGRGATSATDFTYEGGLFSITERMFLGFRKVITVVDAEGNYTETFYYQKVGSTNKPEYTYFKDNQGNIYNYSKYVYTENLEPPYTSVLTERWEYNCDLNNNCLITLNQFAYDQYANVIATYEWGNYEVEGDEKTTIRGYYPNNKAYIRGLPAYENTYQGIGSDGQLLNQVLFYYDDNSFYVAAPQKGDLTTAKKWNNQNGSFVSTSFEYDEYGNKIKEIDELGNEVTTIFDPIYHSYPTEACNAFNQCAKKVWNYTMGQIEDSIDLNGAKTHYEHDALGRVRTITHPDKGVVEYQYLDTGNPDSQRKRVIEPDGSPNGLWKELYQDGLGREYKVVKEGGFEKKKDYISTTSGILRESLWYKQGETPQWVSYTYDGLGRVNFAENPDGSYKEFVHGFDYEGFVYEATYDELGHEKVTWKDVLGNVVQIREKNNADYHYTTYEYNALGKLIRLVDAIGQITTATWDSLGRKLTSCDPAMGCWSYEYDEAGLLQSQTDAKKQKITFTHDALGRIKNKILPDGKRVQYFYDEPGFGASIGRSTRTVYPGGSESHTYDLSGRKISITRCVEGVCKTVKQDYDYLGRVSNITYPDEEIVHYKYDEVGNLDKVVGYADQFEWSAGGQLESIQFANNTKSDFKYDETRKWLDSISITGPTGQLFDAVYEYDVAAHVTSVSSLSNPALDKIYAYDDLNRLTGIAGNYLQNFAYDAVGNRTFAYHSDTIQPPLQQAQYVYDENGNLINDGDRIFSWDAENRLLSVQKNGVTVSYLYDSNGNRVRKTRSSGSTKYFGSLVELKNGSLIKYYYAGPILIAKQEAGNNYWYHSDRLNSVRLITDSNGQPINNYEYAAFGKTINESVTVPNERSFTGHINDPEAGLIYMGARYYDASIGRFISPDTIVPDPTNPQSLNRYTYCYNNPISNIDPSGHAPVVVAVVQAVFVTYAKVTVMTYIAWIGAGVTTVGYFTDNPDLMTFGNILLGIAGGMTSSWVAPAYRELYTVVNVFITFVSSSEKATSFSKALGWAWTAYGVIGRANYNSNLEKAQDVTALIEENPEQYYEFMRLSFELDGATEYDAQRLAAKYADVFKMDQYDLEELLVSKVSEYTKVAEKGFWGSQNQLWYGKISAEIRSNLGATTNGWLEILRNPSGGMMGPGTWAIDIGGFLGAHSVWHDATGAMTKSWWYIYWRTPGILPTPLGGQVGGITTQLLWNQVGH